MSEKRNFFCRLMEIEKPIIQAGMIWCSGWKLASTCSNSGILGVIGSGSMYPDVLDTHVQKCLQATDRPFAVNLPLLYPQIDDHLEIIFRHKVPVVITSAGNPMKYTEILKSKGVKVMHVVSSTKFAKKAQQAGVDAIIAEGFEAGGHNGREETTTLCLIPKVVQEVDLPVVAAGGISSGAAMLAAMNLGASGVQIGSRFVASEESSAHPAFKKVVVEAKEGATSLTLKELTPVRLIRNKFFNQIESAYANCASNDQLRELLGRGRAKQGMFEGELDEGELEIGQVSGLIKDIKPAKDIIQGILKEYQDCMALQLSDERFSF